MRGVRYLAAAVTSLAVMAVAAGSVALHRDPAVTPKTAPAAGQPTCSNPNGSHKPATTERCQLLGASETVLYFASNDVRDQAVGLITDGQSGWLVVGDGWLAGSDDLSLTSAATYAAAFGGRLIRR